MRRWLLPLFVAALTLMPMLAEAQNLSPLNINVDEDLFSSRRIFQMIVLITVLSLAPGIVMMVTSFTRIVIVFSFLRTAMGLQTTPPNMVLVSLAFFMTLFIMAPTMEQAYNTGIGPYLENNLDEAEAFDATVKPFRQFMAAQVGDRELGLFVSLMKDAPEIERPEDAPLQALVPAFMISELKRAFEIGFLIFLPFLVIDLAIAAVLMSMGMMMLPPVIISLPFKVIFFVLIDGWVLLTSSLVQSFNTNF